ncbi:F-box domain [Macleaya cordata]|uniref:F-box domain n=1 Tax=Macleaya cordata TaxID=56857 RepID=A0A200R8I1_MACCD|nr:F-box domain [Macleaya cordata]
MEKRRVRIKEDDYNNTTTTTTYLTEDVLFEIFLRLPFESVYKFRCVSKLWLSLLSNPSFMNMILNRYISINPPWTLVFQLTRLRTSGEVGPKMNHQFFPTSSPCLHSKFISRHDGFSFKFLTKSYPFKEEALYLLASSNGLVLCSTDDNHPSMYYVCNPLTKQWISLPRPRPNSERFGIDGFICESSSLTSTSTYKVLRILYCWDRFAIFDLQIFSSDTGEWNTYQVSCPREVIIYTNNVVTCRDGVLYFILELEQNKIIAYDFSNNKNGGHQCRLIDLPEDREKNLFCTRRIVESEGSICYGQIQREQRTLNVWELKLDYSNGGWVWHVVHKNIEIKDIFAPNIKTWFRAFNPVDRNVLILDCKTYILAYNIRTGTSEVLNFHNSICTTPNISTVSPPFLVTPKLTIIPPPS